MRDFLRAPVRVAHLLGFAIGWYIGDVIKAVL